MTTSSKKRKKSPGHSPAMVVEHLQQLVLWMDSESVAAETRLLLLHSERILKAAKGSLLERRALASKETDGLGILCRCLEMSPNPHITGCMLQILDILADHKYRVKMVEADCVRAIFASFVSVARQGGGAPQSAVDHLKLLLKLAPKDKRFGSKARWCGAVSAVHSLLRTTAQQAPPDQLMVVLQTIRTLAANSVNVSSFCKLGTDGVLVKLLQGNKLRDLAMMKCAADCLTALLKQNKAGSTKAAQSAVKCLIPAIGELHRLDRHTRHTAVLLSLLQCLKTATEYSTACKELFRARGGHAKLLPVVEEWNEGQTKALADLATAGCALLRLCLPEDVVDVPTFSHVLSFSLPKAARASGSSEQEDDVEHSQEEDALEGEGTSDADEGLEDEEELDERLTGEEELAPDTADTSLQHQGKAQSVESACHVAVRPKPTEGSPGESCAQQEPGWDDCSTSSSAMCQEDNGLLFVKSRSPPPLTGEQLLTTEDSDRPESDAPGLQSRAIPGEEGEGHSASTLSLPPSSDHSDTCLSLKTSSDLSASSSSSALPGRDLSQFDHFFPELGNRCSPSSAVALGSKSGHCGSCGVQGEEGEEEEILTVESVSTSELLTTDEGSQLSVSNVEDTGSKEEVAFLQEAPPPVHSVDVLGATPPFVAYKDSHPPELELQYKKPTALNRKMDLHSVWRYLNAEALVNQVVYDLQSELQSEAGGCEGEGEAPRGADPEAGCLKFDARFESGNLMRAVRVQGNEYDLLLSSDINSDHYHHWFCFKVTGMVPGVPYVFNIINFETPSSQFKQGMQPLLFSVKEAETCGRGWVRAGENVTYFTNNYKYHDMCSGQLTTKKHRTATFSVTFPHTDDVCYLAYHYPYLYTDLMTDLLQFEAELSPSDVYYRHQTLCSTLKGNACPIITVTSKEENPVDYRGRDYIVLSARVHPGEANSSWVMRGVLKFLVSAAPTAVALRRRYIFKIIPMLNPDGVINGSTRCSLAGCDLNRRWVSPDPVLHPTIYHAKGIISWLIHNGRSPYVYCDFHGHSQIKNVVLFACPDPSGGVATEELPCLLSSMAPLFNLRGCTYKIQKSKEAAARVVVWRMGVVQSYTMEASYCGASIGRCKGYQVSPRELEEMGRCFCEALQQMGSNLPSHTGNEGQPHSTQDSEARPSDQSLELKASNK